jgi:hypothetical protein
MLSRTDWGEDAEREEGVIVRKYSVMLTGLA